MKHEGLHWKTNKIGNDDIESGLRLVEERTDTWNIRDKQYAIDLAYTMQQNAYDYKAHYISPASASFDDINGLPDGAPSIRGIYQYRFSPYEDNPNKLNPNEFYTKIDQYLTSVEASRGAQ